MGKFSRDKGKRYEQKLDRGYRLDGYETSRNSNQAHPDAVGDDPKGDILGVIAGPFRIHVQAKHDEHLSIWKALKQAIADAAPGWIPTVHFHRNNDGDYVALPLEDWKRLLDALRSR